jgi:hypothetical protein
VAGDRPNGKQRAADRRSQETVGDVGDRFMKLGTRSRRELEIARPSSGLKLVRT